MQPLATIQGSLLRLKTLLLHFFGLLLSTTLNLERKEGGGDSSFQFIYDDPSTDSQVFVRPFHEVLYRGLECLNFNLRADVRNASKNDRAASLVLVPEKSCSNQREVPLCAFNGVLHGPLLQRRGPQQTGQGCHFEGNTCLIVEFATRVPLAWRWGFRFNSFCSLLRSFTMLFNPGRISESEVFF